MTKDRSPAKPTQRANASQAKKNMSEEKDAVPEAQLDWRAKMLDRMRHLIHEADPEMIEEQKWKKPSNAMTGVPVWSHNGIVCTGEAYKNVVKLTFAKGASLPDPAGLFNSSLEGNTRRAIDIQEGETIDTRAFKTLVKAAVALNTSPKVSTKARPKEKAQEKRAKPVARPGKLQKNEQGVVLLSGGNPQIAKGDGDGPVQAYIAAMPGWKKELGKRLDAIIEQNVPHVLKAVRWNSPFYGVEGKGWFVSFHVLTRYVKVTFFAGMSLRPIPPGGTEKSKEARWIDIYEEDPFDEAQLTTWMRQAASIPGWIP